MSRWIQQLLGLTIVAGALEFLLPLGELRRFSRMILGMVLVFTMASPLLSLRGLGPPALPSLSHNEPQKREDLVRRVFQLRLAGELTELLGSRGTCREAKAYWDSQGQLERVEATISGSEGEDAGELIAKHLGLDRGQVSVVEEGTE
jgi:hypothetical protein